MLAILFSGILFFGFGVSLFGCSDDEPRNCDDCPVLERQKVIHVAAVRRGTSIDFTSASTLVTTLLAAELGCNAIIIRNVSGSYDGGSLTEGKGPGKSISRVIGGTHVLTFTDFNYVGNEAFWNRFKDNSQNFTLIYFTDTRAWRVNKPITTIPKPAVGDDNQQFIEAEITMKWSDKDHPVSYPANTDELAECQELFDGTELTVTNQSGSDATIDGFDVSIDANDTLAIAIDTDADIETVSVDSGTLPTGVTLSVSGENITLSGTPTVAGTYDLVIRASNACGVAGIVDLKIIVSA